MTVYKPLPGGGFTSLVCASEKERTKLLAAGWSPERPVIPVAPEPEYAELTEPDGGMVIRESRKRGRPRLSVN